MSPQPDGMTADRIRTAAVLGAGTMGAGIAQVCAQAGIATRLHDVTEDLARRGCSRIDDMLTKGVEKGKVEPSERERVLSLIEPSWSIPRSVAGADVVIEAVPESLELKQETFRAVADHVSCDALLATNTSSLPVSAIARAVPCPERFVGMHFFNPVPLMKLLEIVRGEATSDAAIELAKALGARLGKDPIVVRDAPGFASSRLGIALGLEAMRMVEEGVASPSDIDKAMELGYRHPMGPLKLTDLVGLDVRLAIALHLRSTLDDRRFDPPQILREHVQAGRLGKKSGEGFYRWVAGEPLPR